VGIGRRGDNHRVYVFPGQQIPVIGEYVNPGKTAAEIIPRSFKRVGHGGKPGVLYTAGKILGVLEAQSSQTDYPASQTSHT
jgi:hypothetical protein